MPGWQWRWQQHTVERSVLLQLIVCFAVGLLYDVQGVGMFKLQDLGVQGIFSDLGVQSISFRCTV